jgi:hypothetical protein
VYDKTKRNRKHVETSKPRRYPKKADKPVLERRCICAFCLAEALEAAVAAALEAGFVLVAMFTGGEELMRLS